MNSTLYSELIEDKFSSWMGSACYLVQDFERALRTDESMYAFKNAGIEVIKMFPKCSQDLNAIENCWMKLREELDKTQPKGLEDRDSFIQRVWKAVKILNTKRKGELLKSCYNQKERANEMLKLKGGRTSW